MDIEKDLQVKLSEFAEKYMNISLSKYQKIILDNYNPKVSYYIPVRNNKRIMIFYKALQQLLNMKDDDVIIIMKRDGFEKMNREQFATYLTDEFWK